MVKIPAIVKDYNTPVFRKLGIYFRLKRDANKALTEAKENGIRARLYKRTNGYLLKFY